MSTSADERLRPEFICSNPQCGQPFGYPVAITHQGIIVVTCPQCNTRSSVNLDPYRRNSVGVFRGDGQSAPDAGGTFDFPDRIATEAHEEKDVD